MPCSRSEDDSSVSSRTLLNQESGVDPSTGALRWLPGILRRSAALAAADVIGMKSLNDRYGFKAGDLILEAVGHRLVHGLGPEHRVFRVGGDDFCVEISGPLDRDAAESLAHQIRRLANQLIPGVPALATVRVGVSLQRIGDDEERVIRSAATARWQAALTGDPISILGPEADLVCPCLDFWVDVRQPSAVSGG